MFRVIVASSLSLSAADSAVPLEAALAQDDQCSSGADGCTLNALQLKATQSKTSLGRLQTYLRELRTRAVEPPEANEEEDPCKSGVVGELRAEHQACFDACPTMCMPMEDVIGEFLTNGEPEARAMVCQKQHDFSCAFTTGRESCKALFFMAKDMGVTLPADEEGLEAQCQASLLEKVEESSSGPCASSPMAAEIRENHPLCFAACPGLCAPLEAVFAAYGENGVDGGKVAICEHVDEFACTLRAGEVCRGFLDSARVMGAEVPATAEKFRLGCAMRMAAALVEVETESQVVSEAAALRVIVQEVRDAVGYSREDDACDSGIVGEVKKAHPECFEACPDICEPMENVVEAFLQKGEQAAKGSVCAATDVWMCALGSGKEQCEGLRATAADAGVKLPADAETLATECKTFWAFNG